MESVRKIIIAPDKFKGTFSAPEMCHLLEKSIRVYDSQSELKLMPSADGGEGTVECIAHNTSGFWQSVKSFDALGREIETRYWVMDDGKCAVVEMADSCGLGHLQMAERNVLKSSSFGFGNVIYHALSQGVKRFILTIGGSASNDCGLGMLAALGFSFVLHDGTVLDRATYLKTPEMRQLYGGESMGLVQKIIFADVPASLNDTEFKVACDVDNPLLGKNGAAFVYSPQKGASFADVCLLDEAASWFVSVWSNYKKFSVSQNGGGAAGGVGLALSVFLNAQIVSGAGLVASIIGIAQELRNASLLVTGEGCLDSQSLSGKTPITLVNMAKELGVSAVVVCGRCKLSVKEIKSAGIDRVILLQDIQNGKERI